MEGGVSAWGKMRSFAQDGDSAQDRAITKDKQDLARLAESPKMQKCTKVLGGPTFLLAGLRGRL